jgi:NAD(P)-dependent dehydrogenase (short-subunit alcohol dehydrogenase family)
MIAAAGREQPGMAASNDLFDLRDKVAIVTGSSRGIGRAIAERFAERGARVVISSRDGEACANVVQAIAAAGGTAIAVPAHIGKKEQLQALVDRTIAEWGGIDVVVANAAVNPYFGPMSGIQDDAWDRIIDSNVRSTMWLANMTFPLMAERGGGSAIFLSSIAGLGGSEVIGAYAVSKTALIGLAKSLALEWGPRGVRVNCLAPGIVKTEFARALWDNPKIADPATERAALRRLAEPDDIAGAAIFLAARASAMITGQTIVIDGGTTIGAGV